MFLNKFVKISAACVYIMVNSFIALFSGGAQFRRDAQMAIQYVPEATCWIQELHPLSEMPLRSNVRRLNILEVYLS